MILHRRMVCNLPLLALLAAIPACGRHPSTSADSRHTRDMSTDGSMNMSGMQMDEGQQQTGSASSVAGHAVVQITPTLAQQIGVTTGQVEEFPLRMQVRTVGIVRPDETRLSEVYLKTQGWVDKLFVNFTGQTVKAGDPLLTIYSPEFLSTQQEYLTARQGRDPAMAAAAERRLQLWDVPQSEIDELERTKTPHKDLTLRSPLSGTVLQRGAFQGQRVTSGDKLYTIADLSTVWVQAKVYEYELPHVALGQPAHITLAALPGQRLAGKVVFVQPTVEERTRTTEVRIELTNPSGKLKPGMFAQVTIEHSMGTGLLVPTSAVIRTGERDLVYRAEDQNRYVPAEVKTDSFRYGDRFHVIEGLKAGDRIVTSANFLIDSESRLRAGGGGMASMPGMDMSSMPGMSKSKSEPANRPDTSMPGMKHGKMQDM